MGSNDVKQLVEESAEDAFMLRMIDAVTHHIAQKEPDMEVLSKNLHPANGWANLVYRTDDGLTFAHVKDGMEELDCPKMRAWAEADASNWLASHPDSPEEKILFAEFCLLSQKDGKALLRGHYGLFEKSEEVERLEAEIKSLKARIAELEAGAE